MTSLTLFFVGSVYLINGLVLLRLISAKGAAPLNIFIGALLLATAAFVILPLGDLSAPSSVAALASGAGYLLFALTFLYVGVINLAGSADDGLGWYCGWAALVALCLAAMQLNLYGDVKSAALWFVWFVVFAAFFALIILKARADRATGWLVVVAGFTTCFVPGGLMILGEWAALSDALVITMEAATVAVFVVLLTFSPRTVAAAKEQRA